MSPTHRVTKDSVVGAKFVNLHWSKSLDDLLEFKNRFESYRIDTGMAIGTQAYQLQLDFLSKTDRDACTRAIEREVKRRG